MATSRRFVQITDKEINKIKITCVKILKQLFTSGSVIIGKYSPRLRRIIVKYWFTEPIILNEQRTRLTDYRTRKNNSALCTRLIYLRLKTTDFWATMA